MVAQEVFEKRGTTEKKQEPRMAFVPVKEVPRIKRMEKFGIEAGCVLSVLEEMKEHSRPNGSIRIGHPSKAGRAIETSANGQKNFNHYCHENPNYICERMESAVKKLNI